MENDGDWIDDDGHLLDLISRNPPTAASGAAIHPQQPTAPAVHTLTNQETRVESSNEVGGDCLRDAGQADAPTHIKRIEKQK